MEKVCKYCGIIKNILEFRKSKTCKDGFYNKCKKCINSTNCIWESKNKEKVLQYKKNYSIKNLEKAKLYYKKNKIQLIKKIKDYKIKNKEKYIHYRKKHYLKYKQIYSLKNKIDVENLSNRYIKNKMRGQGFSKEARLNDELKETIKLIIKTKRLCRTSQNYVQV